MGLNIKFYDDRQKEGEIVSVGYIPVDTKARKDSRRLASSGAVAKVEEKVKARVPDAVVVFVSNPFGCCPDRFSSSHDDSLGIWNNNDNTIFEYARAMKDVANFDSCYYIPVYEECGINSENFEDYLLHEYNSSAQVWVYLHPNDAGAARIERVIENHLKKIAELN